MCARAHALPRLSVYLVLGQGTVAPESTHMSAEVRGVSARTGVQAPRPPCQVLAQGEVRAGLRGGQVTVPPCSSHDPAPCPAHITPASLRCPGYSEVTPLPGRAMRNSTNSTETLVTDVILLGFPGLCHLQGPLLGSFFTIYMVTVLENLAIVVTIRASHPLHTPAYYFWANLSVLETLYTSVTVPKLWAGLLASARTVSFSGCLTSCSSSSASAPLSASSWPPRPVTGSWPSVACCASRPSRTRGSAESSPQLLAGWLPGLLCVHGSHLLPQALWPQRPQPLLL